MISSAARPTVHDVAPESSDALNPNTSPSSLAMTCSPNAAGALRPGSAAATRAWSTPAAAASGSSATRCTSSSVVISMPATATQPAVRAARPVAATLSAAL